MARADSRKKTTDFLLQFEDFNYVSFLPFDQTDEEGITDVLMTIDSSIQYGEDLEHREPPVRTDFLQAVYCRIFFGDWADGEVWVEHLWALLMVLGLLNTLLIA